MTARLRELPSQTKIDVQGERPTGFPSLPNSSSTAESTRLLWLGPTEWLVVGDGATAHDGVDVSAGFAAFELSGTEVERVLARICSLDLERSTFAIDRCAQTLLGAAPAILDRIGEETFHIYVRPSYSSYLVELLEDALSLTAPSEPVRQNA